jgi:hypothetical protein
MEKYVLEALFIMGEEEYGLTRMKDRFWRMVEESEFTTLDEHFGAGQDKASSGTNNHAWSGGGLTILSQYACGLAPIEPAWKTFQVKPRPGYLNLAETGNETVAGEIHVKIEQENSSFRVEVNVPPETESIICIPSEYKSVEANGTAVFRRKPVNNNIAAYLGKEDDFIRFRIGPGDYVFDAE